MPKGLIFRLIVMLAVAVAAHFYFRRDTAVPELPNDSHAAPPRVEIEADFARDGRTATAAARLGPCDVTHVTDGDTLNVRCAARKERVRMLQIDTPEREDPLYEAAGDALEALIAGRSVELELGPEERDDHGRLLAYVFAGGENLNLAMIEAGWSPYFDRYGAGAYPREFAEAERSARRAKRGIWRSRGG
jgi:endonuclease YncB( thermonuclease family)